MRIALLSHAYPRWEGDLAGAFIQRLAAALVGRGHTVTVITPADRGRESASEEQGIHVVRFRYAPALLERLAQRGTMAKEAATPWGAVAFANLVRQSRLQLQRTNTDVVHAHWWIPGGLSAVRAADRNTPRPVMTLHGSDVRLARRLPGGRRLARSVLTNAARLTTVSATLAARAAALAGTRADDVDVIPMPADQSTLPREPDPDRHGIVTVARLVPQKRLELLVEAVALLPSTRRPRLTIVGDGPARPGLERLAGQFGIDATFTGLVPPDRVSTQLAVAAVAVFPALDEGFGLSAAEALMCGTPVVVTKDGAGLVDAITSHGGGVVVDPTPQAIADALADRLDSTEARAAAWEAGLAWREALAPDAVAARFEEVYRHVT